ncbi:methyltransferase domain-containing protein [Fictibacillus sp. KU28468]|uniref:methyltransferase domain-containing protein n=1 Tax=Fictibacillus sp. KU28468 TaxID=2991053 RepID=UPI00223D7E0D|nr:methyltransferase domain-containing protein [Fictibacillus sp. KU28468]UZJ77360.1 class I SAM-dependent methyltransferase [Fictibacillus sp. KU28468]
MLNNFSIRPKSRNFGSDRGKPIDRFYIEKFLENNRAEIKGHVLEVGDNYYTRIYGTNVSKSDVLNLIPSPEATIVGDLATGENIPHEVFDCIILTQVIHVIYDIKMALNNTIKALKPGGTLLITTTGLSASCRTDFHGDYWRFTDTSLRMLLNELVDEEKIEIEVFGNVAVAKAFLDGLAVHEIPEAILGIKDDHYQVILTAIVKK